MPQRGKMPAMPVLPPASAYAGNEQLQNLYAQFHDILGTLGVQRSQLRSAFGNSQQAIIAQRQQGLSAAENTGIERGILGSSGDFQNRITVRANASTALSDAKNQELQGLLSNRAQALSAYRDFQTGVFNVQAGQANDLVMQSIQDFINNSFNNGGGGGGRGGGGSGQDNGAGGRQQSDKGPGSIGTFGPHERKILNDLRGNLNAAIQNWSSTREGRGKADAWAAVLDAFHSLNQQRGTYGMNKQDQAWLQELANSMGAQQNTGGTL